MIRRHTPKYNEDGTEKVKQVAWTYEASFLNAVSEAADLDGLKPTQWVKIQLIEALKVKGLWPLN
jgi:hypothetical protein